MISEPNLRDFFEKLNRTEIKKSIPHIPISQDFSLTDWFMD